MIEISAVNFFIVWSISNIVALAVGWFSCKMYYRGELLEVQDTHAIKDNINVNDVPKSGKIWR